MNLLYLLNKSYYSSDGEKGYLLNSKYDISFNESEMKLCIKRNDDYIDGFWGEHIFDAMAIVGENGSGKTKLANCIMNTLDYLETSHINRDTSQFIIVFEDKIGDETGVKIFVTRMFEQIIVDSTIKCEMQHASKCKKILEFKMGYFTNVLSLNDYAEKKYGIIFDSSLGGSIAKYYKDDFEMHYINVHKDKIINYYDDELWKILDFINFDLYYDQIPFNLPKHIKISVKDYKINLKYRSDELNDIGKKRSYFLPYIFAHEAADKNVLKEGCEYILKKFGNNERSYLSINLILNLFRELASNDALEEDTLRLLIEFDRINEYLNIYDKIFDMMVHLLKNIQQNIQNKNIIDPFLNFTNWLLKIPLARGDIFDSFNNYCFLELPPNDTKVHQLLTHYKATNSAYPYLSFNFGLSTGEFNLLKLFSKIAGLLEENRKGERYVLNNVGCETKCENLLLYFDEIDLSLHPRWQQKYLDWLLQFISAFFKNCTVQIIIATHSPIMLSDFPCNNVLYLWKDKEKSYAEKREIKTFGNNIHTLFMDSFFLDEEGTMGSFAERKINEIANDLKYNLYPENKNTLKIINNIGDDIIRNKLLQIYNSKTYAKEEITQVNANDDVIDTTIEIIKSQINNLQNTIKELEKMKGDKN